MFEVIKNLKPAHRLQAFLIAALLTTASAILTVYLKTDDCSGLAKQYQVLVNNYSETMTINNILIESNNKKDRDMMVIKDLLVEMGNIKPESRTQTTVRSNNNAYLENAYSVVKNDSVGYGVGNEEILLSAMIKPSPKEKIIETKTTITKVPEKQKSLIKLMQGIIKKYEDK